MDTQAMEYWIYPNGTSKEDNHKKEYVIRDYQVNISRTALFFNTLVCLPTGLGKTLIASVVIYNFYRWFPRGKIIFMAPTRPLVSQQITACQEILTLPEKDIVSLEGSISASNREKLWNSKRVFYCTPQVVENDLNQNRIDISSVVCVIIDEAHRATGNYAYVNVMKSLMSVNKKIRVLALSATPGADARSIQKIVYSLYINKIEWRSESDPDVEPFVFDKQIEIIKCRNVINVQETFKLQINEAMEVLTRHLLQQGLLMTSEAKTINSFILGEVERNIEINRSRYDSSLMTFVSLLKMLVNSRKAYLEEGVEESYKILKDLIQRSGYRSFNNPAEKFLCKSSQFVQLCDFFKNYTEQAENPKIPKLCEILQEHFSINAQTCGVLVFVALRSTVQCILSRLKSLSGVRAEQFIGQASSKATNGKSQQVEIKGQSQREQEETIKKFKTGAINVLVATCIAEEGLDIGNVDLIICFDSVASPIRMIQRIGRTGRQNEGKVIMLVQEGKDEDKLVRSNDAIASLKCNLASGNNKLTFYEGPSIFPPGHEPKMKLMTEVQNSSKSSPALQPIPIDSNKENIYWGKSQRQNQMNNQKLFSTAVFGRKLRKCSICDSIIRGPVEVSSNESENAALICELCNITISQSLAAENKSRASQSSSSILSFDSPIKEFNVEQNFVDLCFASTPPKSTNGFDEHKNDELIFDEDISFMPQPTRKAASLEQPARSHDKLGVPKSIHNVYSQQKSGENSSSHFKQTCLSKKDQVNQNSFAQLLKHLESIKNSELDSKLNPLHWNGYLGEETPFGIGLFKSSFLSREELLPLFLPQNAQPKSEFKIDAEVLLSQSCYSSDEDTSEVAHSHLQPSKPQHTDDTVAPRFVVNACDIYSSSSSDDEEQELEIVESPGPIIVSTKDNFKRLDALDESWVSSCSPPVPLSSSSRKNTNYRIGNISQTQRINGIAATQSKPRTPASCGLDDTSIYDNDGDMPCGVCGSNEVCNDDHGVFCDGPCGSFMHLHCYGLKEVPSTKEFFCQGCTHKRRGKREVYCQLCQKADGLLRLSNDHNWVHPMCALFTPELQLDENMNLVNTSKLDRDRRFLECKSCGGHGGANVQCAHGNCLQSFHPFCAFIERKQMIFRLQNEESLQYEIYCDEHKFNFNPGKILWAAYHPPSVPHHPPKGDSKVYTLFDSPNVEKSFIMDTPEEAVISSKSALLTSAASLHSGNSSFIVDTPDHEAASWISKRQAKKSAKRQRPEKHKLRRVARDQVNQFFEIEAELSGSDSGDDIENSDEERNEYENSFINDGEYTQMNDSRDGVSLYFEVNSKFRQTPDSPGSAEQLKYRFRGGDRPLPITNRILKNYKQTGRFESTVNSDYS